MSEIAVVTGASRGIGKEICLQLAQQEISTVAVARSENLLARLAATNANIHAIPADLVDEKEVEYLVNQVIEMGKVKFLINNAGALINKTFKELKLADWRSQIESNLISTVHVTRKLLPQFAKPAHIVNISSMGGFQGSDKFPGLAAYSASKGALGILTESLAVELAGDGIRANALCLGAVQTEMFEEAFPGLQAPVTATDMGKYIADFALKGHRFYNGKILPVALGNPD